MKDYKTLEFILSENKIDCDRKCAVTPNSQLCKLRIFIAKCPVKALKESYRTGCYEVVDKNGGEWDGRN